jgi:hypothetical protein
VKQEVPATKRWLISNGIHGVTSEKMELFITTAVRTSNPTVTDYKAGNERKCFRRLCGTWALRNGTVGMILMGKYEEHEEMS